MTFILILNRFTINSDNHNHDNASRIASRDDTNVVSIYWLRSAGMGYAWDSHFRTIAVVWTSGGRGANNVNYTNRGFRPIL